MKQILQQLRTGETLLVDVPAPSVESGHLLIRTRASLVSQGTEKMLVQFGKASLFQKARSQPEKVRQVLQKIRTDGLRPTVDAVFRRLDEPLPLGYCNAGEVIGVGEGVAGFTIGDRVASNGPHAEVVAVPANLCAKVPDAVSDEEAAFTIAASIALQGIRLAGPTLGETIAVVGLGLLGQLAVQLLRANGCRVIGFDFDAEKAGLARRFGVEAQCVAGENDPVKHALAMTHGLGVDAVIITASTKSNDVIAQAARMSRKRGRIVLVGVIGLEINRADFYEKELTFQVSCSYGPGRYEAAYEEKGFDYPPGFVRWTEQRNFEAVLAAMATGGLQVKPLITRQVPLQDYRDVYDDLNAAGLASVLLYGETGSEQSELPRTEENAKTTPGPSAPSANPGRTASTIRISRRSVPAPALAIVGAGNFTKMTAMPALTAVAAPVKYIASSGGVTGTSLAKKYDVPFSTTDFEAVLADPDVRGVIITTRHNLHAAQAVAAVNAGKHVLVEKPLCLTTGELAAIERAVRSAGDQPPMRGNGPTLTVGFNRRFSPHARKVRELLGDRPGPLSMLATMNAGAIPLNHWVHDPEIGGGRLLGEACHYVDLAVFIAASPVTQVCATPLGGGGAPGGDSASILLRHANGSASTINYLSNGHRAYPKECVEVFSQERVLAIDDFRETTGFGFKRFARLKTRTDKGHAAQFGAFAQRVRDGGLPLIPWSETVNVARATLAIGESLRRNAWVTVEIQ